MEYGSRMRWWIAIVGIVLLLTASIIGLVLVGMNIFGGDDDSAGPTQVALSEYNRSNVRFSVEVQGPVVAKENFNAFRLTVSRTERVMQVIRGYDGFIVKAQRLDNTESAFRVFLKAIDRAGFDRINRGYENEDEEGVCATDRRFIYKIEEEGAEIFRSWRGSCSDGIGTSQAPRAVRQLFQEQFPDFSEFTRGLGLR